MAMLTVNGLQVPAPSALKIVVFDVGGGVKRSASGLAMMDRTAVKRRLSLSWARMDGSKLAELLGEVSAGFFEVEYPDPASGAERSMTCYCSDRATGILRMIDGGPVWTNVEMTWTER